MTEYEQAQVEAIAAWKAESPGLAKRMIRTIASPLGNLVNKMMPKAAISAAMDGVNKMAGQLAQDDNIFKDSLLKSQSIASLEDIAAQPLEFADALADRIINDAGHIAIGMGAVTGTGGLVAATAGIPPPITAGSLTRLTAQPITPTTTAFSPFPSGWK